MPTDKKNQPQTPGVYVTELDAFPPSIVGVETALPAFIGYTQQARVGAKPVTMQPVKISSLADFKAIFGTGFQPLFDINPVSDGSAIDQGLYDVKVLENSSWKYYALKQTTPGFNLYPSMQLFYANGGGSCYVVSVGDYTAQGSQPYGAPVEQGQLALGLDAIAQQTGPTMLLIPDAVLLSSDADKPWMSSAFKDTVQQMLEQCATLQDRIAVLDIYGAEHASNANLADIIDSFRQAITISDPGYGAAYFPPLNTDITLSDSLDYTSIAPSSIDVLMALLKAENTYQYSDTQKYHQVEQYIDAIATTDASDKTAVSRLNQNLVAALPMLMQILQSIANKLNQLPASAAMAGVLTQVDNSQGVWNAPANIALHSVRKPGFTISNEQQSDLNAPLDGKAVNAIREFSGRGTLVWGARTLDGNSNDWRYIQVRRTLIYIEQSIKNALDPLVFAANDGNTWATATSMISSFLQGLWSQGGLMGATAAEAYTVQCGLGSTMTSQDILDGYMIVQVMLQMIRPAEFIELTFKQKIESSA